MKKDEALVGEIGFFSYDHWLQAQDSEEPKIFVQCVIIHSPARATVKVCIGDLEGAELHITFPLVYESKNWFIDDFITEYDGKEWSEKAQMKEYLDD